MTDGKLLRVEPEQSESSSKSFQTRLAAHLAILHLRSLILFTKNTATLEQRSGFSGSERWKLTVSMECRRCWEMRHRSRGFSALSSWLREYELLDSLTFGLPRGGYPPL